MSDCAFVSRIRLLFPGGASRSRPGSLLSTQASETPLSGMLILALNGFQLREPKWVSVILI